MAFLEEDKVRCKIIVDNKCLQQVQNFKYLGCDISCESKKKKKYSTEIAKFAQILRILNSTFKPTLAQKSSRIKV